MRLLAPLPRQAADRASRDAASMTREPRGRFAPFCSSVARSALSSPMTAPKRLGGQVALLE